MKPLTETRPTALEEHSPLALVTKDRRGRVGPTLTQTGTGPTAIDHHYWPEIDGLRAIAVLVVLVFHLQLPAPAGAFFSGGFVGVDVFFVISGFLITRQIQIGLGAKAFSLGDFFQRRARRILPALLVVLGATAVGAFLLMTPNDSVSAARSLLASIVGAANLYFASTAGYFDIQASAKPFLHTWSLGVEEQFYLLWPLFLLLAGKTLSPRMSTVALIIFFAGSLAAAEMMVRVDRAQAFYWAPFRAYEFLIGAALTWTGSLRHTWREVACAAGLTTIIASVVAFASMTPFPGVSALAPALGAAGVIAGRGSTTAAVLLANRPAVSVGRISYSLYLTHWPTLVLYRYLLPKPPSPVDYVIMAALSFLFAVLLYHRVERPWRSPEFIARLGPRSWFAAVALFAITLAGAAVSLLVSDGWPERFPEAVAETLEMSVSKANLYVWRNLNNAPRAFAGDGRAKLLIIGDSQAADFLNVLVESRRSDDFDIAVRKVAYDCQPVIPRSPAYYAALGAGGASCRRVHDQIANSDALKNADTVVLAASWAPSGVAEVAHTLAWIKQRSAAKVVVVGSKLHGSDSPHIVMLSALHHQNLGKVAASFRRPETLAINGELAAIAGPDRFVDIYAALCPSVESCHVVTGGGRLITYDGAHLTQAGAAYVGGLLTGPRGLDLLGPR